MMALSNALSVEVVRGLDQWLEAMSIRAMIYIGEQDYPYAEEFDGGDLAGATHLIARDRGEPVGACRIRWFADFAKLERVAVKRANRSGQVPRVLWRAAAELTRRKGYRLMLGHIERSLLPFWERAAGFKRRDGRESYFLCGREFVEAVVELQTHPEAIGLDSPAALLLASESTLAVAPAAFRRAS